MYDRRNWADEYQTWSFEQAETMFLDEVLPEIKKQHEQDGVADYPARCEGWCNFIDLLNKNGDINDVQASDWPHPQCNLRPGETQ
jgi:hypothetical protein|tara:strand:- start:22706 stop:22960 length:255 start_codon:yes stop_codon:yes gene_type:complete